MSNQIGRVWPDPVPAATLLERLLDTPADEYSALLASAGPGDLEQADRKARAMYGAMTPAPSGCARTMTR
jgi:hypothetical protein